MTEELISKKELTDEKITEALEDYKEVLLALIDLVEACSVHPFPNLPIQEPLKRAKKLLKIK